LLKRFELRGKGNLISIFFIKGPNEEKGIGERTLSFDGEMNYFVVSMGKLAILKV
jgi:hypothetical protein